MTKSTKFEMRLTDSQKEVLRLLALADGRSMGAYVIHRLKLDKKAT